MNKDKFIEWLMDLHSKYGDRLGINDVYAYTALGRVVRAVGTVIISPKSPLSLDGNPKSVFLYFLSNSSVMIMTDLMGGGDALGGCGVRRFEISNDVHDPPNTVTITEILNCDDDYLGRVIKLLRGFGVKALPALVTELGESGFKLLFRGSINSMSELIKYIVVLILTSQLKRDFSNEALIRSRISESLGLVTKSPSP
ncbi:hypothetical protein [Vulcanisaeta thermophila]|uniref:hypothetical protein n=1 Tax=Vulcanisaeta thermophila TaxID=867917 RepID=UPI00117F9BB4|nr:hypothetical protein [Vulcanisaeta thermophila]